MQRLWKPAISVVVLVLGATALAMPAYKAVLHSTYKVKPGSVIAKADCALCHATKSNFKKLNAFGADLDKALKEAKSKAMTAEILKQVEALDSDKDGVKNVDEIRKDTLPGDPKSK